MYVVFSSEQAAASLWDYGEDALVEPALALDDDRLQQAWTLAGRYWDPTFALPGMKHRLTLGHVAAFAVITLLEGDLRPLARERRRAQRSKPEHLRNPKPVPPVATG
jgi:hypothetical protein